MTPEYRWSCVACILGGVFSAVGLATYLRNDLHLSVLAWVLCAWSFDLAAWLRR